MNDDTKKQIRDECGMTLQHFGVIMTKLREAKILINNKINPRFIPNIPPDTEEFQLLLLFEIKK